eukprot:CAMPEP_0196588786 /NCGR_PEP_ID=MMETSP1081-20130531/61724_1 /TAXON_ID=36882 /ORGANISM="Pyramimonas amylifera, Strain CCMP720" /LENGTH=131 /DNA_ID=CAMNT_0041911399 /DNA_START=287 /DNA_END=682 /DNA_ORIENTATION=-
MASAIFCLCSSVLGTPLPRPFIAARIFSLCNFVIACLGICLVEGEPFSWDLSDGSSDGTAIHEDSKERAGLRRCLWGYPPRVREVEVEEREGSRAGRGGPGEVEDMEDVDMERVPTPWQFGQSRTPHPPQV